MRSAINFLTLLIGMQEELLSCNELCGDVLLHSSVLKTGAGLYRAQPVADLGGGAAAPPLASFRKIQGLPILKIVRTADSTIIIITNFYLAASSHEIF